MKAPMSIFLLSLVTAGPFHVDLRAQANPTLAPVAQSTALSLDDEGLRQMLVGMGYQPKALSKGFLIVIKLDTWTYNIQLVLSGNRSKLGINANLGKVNQPETIPAATWLKLLVDNGDLEPSMFYFAKEQKKLYLHRVMDNRALTPAYLREQIDTFCQQMHDSLADWKFTD